VGRGMGEEMEEVDEGTGNDGVDDGGLPTIPS
jgi:hypothetical protein